LSPAAFLFVITGSFHPEASVLTPSDGELARRFVQKPGFFEKPGFLVGF
jgi:hypothetical protein